MRAPVSVVIPTLNAERHLPGCLAALGEGLDAGLIRELVISDGGSTDDTMAIAAAAGAEIVSGPAGRGGQLRRGVDAAQGEWLLVLHADSWLEPGWATTVLDHLGVSEQAAVFRLGFREFGLAARIVAGWANWRTRIFGLPFGDQGLLITSNLYKAAGGYADIPLMEDVAMARALKGRMDVLDCKISTSAERYLRDGWVRRSLGNFVLLMRFKLGADPVSLEQSYRSSR